MTEYTCLDCGNEMEREGGLMWNEALTECFYKFKCPNCGSGFEHRLTKEEEDELKQRGKQRKIKCAICGRKDLLLPPLSEYLERDLKDDNAIIICDKCREAPIPEDMHGEQYILHIQPKNSREWLKLIWRIFAGPVVLNKDGSERK